jgi:hypothetical protein
LKEVRKQFFFEKKNQKTFVSLGYGRPNTQSSPDLIGRSTPSQAHNQTVPWFDHKAPVPSSRPAAGMPPRGGAVKDLPRRRRAQRVLDGAEHGGRLAAGWRQF